MACNKTESPEQMVGDAGVAATVKEVATVIVVLSVLLQLPMVPVT